MAELEKMNKYKLMNQIAMIFSDRESWLADQEKIAMGGLMENELAKLWFTSAVLHDVENKILDVILKSRI